MVNVANIFRLNVLITLVCLLLLYYKLRSKIITWIITPPHSRGRFMKIINPKGKLLDVGCGNNSPYNIKPQFPDIMYTGIDIGDYNQTKPIIAEIILLHLLKLLPEKFLNSKMNLIRLSVLITLNIAMTDIKL